jgi:response regulator RpfG family c-di-GMP phosphodiesterase
MVPMTKRVLDVGNCGFDHGRIRALLTSAFGAEVQQAHTAAETLAALENGGFDLVLVNRVLDADGSDGVALIERIRTGPKTGTMPVMLISNFPAHQQRAAAAGAEPGFGKRDLATPETREKLQRFLTPQ